MGDGFYGGEGMYVRGDLVKWREDGEVMYVGRKEDEVKMGGLGIEV